MAASATPATHVPAVGNVPMLDASLRDYLDTNADIVTRIRKPVSIDDVGALAAQVDTPILFEHITEKPGFRLCDILVKNHTLQARALGVPRADYLKTLAFRLRQPPRGFKHVKTGPVKEIIKTRRDDARARAGADPAGTARRADQGGGGRGAGARRVRRGVPGAARDGGDRPVPPRLLRVGPRRGPVRAARRGGPDAGAGRGPPPR